MKNRIHILPILILASNFTFAQQEVHPRADESTPSRAQYFSWINNTNEGATEEQTLINLEFFGWLKREYGMQLDIYAFDAGAIDGKRFYGSIYSDRFEKQFPEGFDPIYEKAKSLGIRLGVWGGPDGFGDTPEEEQARIDQMVKLCKDYEFALFKFDAVCGPLRPEKEDAFIKMMTKCREYSPDLILLNHRLGLSKEAEAHATTFLWEGWETYIDVFMSNWMTAPHHRGAAISRGYPPDLVRLTEDHGVCISSCLDYWDDDLILQAFNRNLILAPEVYANPWLLRDDEYPKFARIYNLHQKYRDIMLDGINLPEKSYGTFAVSRGNENTRLITVRNLNWEKEIYTIDLTEEIGLENNGKIEVRQFHPSERILGEFDFGEKLRVTVDPFRSCLLIVSSKPIDEPAIAGADFNVLRNVEGQPLEIEVLGWPGTSTDISLHNYDNYSLAEVDGKNQKSLLKGKKLKIDFPGETLQKDILRKVSDFEVLDTLENIAWESLYEATVYCADNNALEVRSIQRSGWSDVPEVKAAQDAFFNQNTFTDRGIWDKNLFDGSMETAFWPSKKYNREQTIKGGCFRLDLGEITDIDKLIIKVGDIFSLQPLLEGEGNHVEVSSDLKSWETLTYLAGLEMEIEIEKPVRYLRFKYFPSCIREIEGYTDSQLLDMSNWRASNLFAHPSRLEHQRTWKAEFTLNEVASNSYLCVALNGDHGVEGAYAAAIIDGEIRGAPDRAQSYQSNTWEYVNSRSDKNYTYYIPVDANDVGKPIGVYVLGFDKDHLDFKPEVWIAAYPIPFEKVKLLLEQK
jgi:hypothetical protein